MARPTPSLISILLLGLFFKFPTSQAQQVFSYSSQALSLPALSFRVTRIWKQHRIYNTHALTLSRMASREEEGSLVRHELEAQSALVSKYQVQDAFYASVSDSSEWVGFMSVSPMYSEMLLENAYAIRGGLVVPKKWWRKGVATRLYQDVWRYLRRKYLYAFSDVYYVSRIEDTNTASIGAFWKAVRSIEIPDEKIEKIPFVTDEGNPGVLFAFPIKLVPPEESLLKRNV